MATDLRELPGNLDTDATFRTWGMGIAAQLTACGLVRTDDAGQIDFATVLKPTNPNTRAGFEIYRFDDSLQATQPMYIKLYYGTGSTPTCHSLNHAIGTTTNGAGTLTGYFTADINARANGSAPSAGTLLPSYCCGSASEGRIVLITGDNYSWMGFSIERVRDPSGVLTTDGVALLSFTTAGTSQASFTVFPAQGPPAAVSTTFPAVTDGGSLTKYKNNYALYPVSIYLGQVYWSLNILGYASNAFTAHIPITVTHNGSNHTYLPLSPVYNSSAIAMLWE